MDPVFGHNWAITPFASMSRLCCLASGQPKYEQPTLSQRASFVGIVQLMSNCFPAPSTTGANAPPSDARDDLLTRANILCRKIGTVFHVSVSIVDTNVHRTIQAKLQWHTRVKTHGVGDRACLRAPNTGKCKHSSQKRGQSGPRSQGQQLTNYTHTHCNGYTRVHTGEALS